MAYPLKNEKNGENLYPLPNEILTKILFYLEKENEVNLVNKQFCELILEHFTIDKIYKTFNDNPKATELTSNTIKKCMEKYENENNKLFPYLVFLLIQIKEINKTSNNEIQHQQRALLEKLGSAKLISILTGQLKINKIYDLLTLSNYYLFIKLRSSKAPNPDSFMYHEIKYIKQNRIKKYDQFIGFLTGVPKDKLFNENKLVNHIIQKKDRKYIEISDVDQRVDKNKLKNLLSAFPTKKYYRLFEKSFNIPIEEWLVCTEDNNINNVIKALPDDKIPGVLKVLLKNNNGNCHFIAKFQLIDLNSLPKCIQNAKSNLGKCQQLITEIKQLKQQKEYSYHPRFDCFWRVTPFSFLLSLFLWGIFFFACSPKNTTTFLRMLLLLCTIPAGLLTCGLNYLVCTGVFHGLESCSQYSLNGKIRKKLEELKTAKNNTIKQLNGNNDPEEIIIELKRGH